MRIAALALVAGAALVLAGCTPVTPDPTRTPEPSATPVFASDEEALAAAEKAYGEYLAVSDEVAADGGENPERLENYVTDSRMEVERQGARLLASNGVHTSGATAFGGSELEAVGHRGGDTIVTFFTCWDVSDIRVFNKLGEDVTPSDRVSRQTLEVRMITSQGQLPLRLDGDETWSGRSVCS